LVPVTATHVLRAFIDPPLVVTATSTHRDCCRRDANAEGAEANEAEE
jgi:hypothetical protein